MAAIVFVDVVGSLSRFRKSITVVTDNILWRIVTTTLTDMLPVIYRTFYYLAL